jgi:hypothetical protein
MEKALKQMNRKTIHSFFRRGPKIGAYQPLVVHIDFGKMRVAAKQETNPIC